MNLIPAPASLVPASRGADATSGLYFYGYRFYDPVTGRWPSRDPIGENGGVNLYSFLDNLPILGFDYLGLSRHHWWPQMGPPKGKHFFQGLCGEEFNIDHYTTDLDQKSYDILTFKLGYTNLVKEFLNDGKVDCCDALSFIVELSKMLTAMIGGPMDKGGLGPVFVNYHGGASSNQKFDDFFKRKCCGHKRNRHREEKYLRRAAQVVADAQAKARQQPSISDPGGSTGRGTSPASDQDDRSIRTDEDYRRWWELERRRKTEAPLPQQEDLLRRLRVRFPSTTIIPFPTPIRMPPAVRPAA